MLKKATLAVAFTLLTVPGQATAQGGFYLGFGAGVSDARSFTPPPFGPATSVDTFGIVGVTAGYRWDRSNGFLAAELDADFSSGSSMIGSAGSNCATFAVGPYYCTQDATVRLRAVYGRQLTANYEVFGSVGAVYVSGTSAVSSTTQAKNANTGVTFGVGVQRALGKGMLRAEITHDIANRSLISPGGFVPHYEATTAKVSYIFRF